MIVFLRFEGRRIFGDKKNFIFLSSITLLSIYFFWSGLNEYRQFIAEKKVFVKFEKEKFDQLISYSQYGGFGFRLLYEPPALGLFFVNSNVLQNVESNIDSLEVIRVESSFKGNKLFLKRGYFKDFAGILFVFGSLLMLYLGNLALVSPSYLRFMAERIPLKRFFCLTTIARLFWLDLFFIALGLGLLFMAQFGVGAFSSPEKMIFIRYLLFLIILLDFTYLLGQLTAVLVRFRRISFFWFFIVWFVCIFLLPEVSRITVFNNSQSLELADKVNLEKFRNLMVMEKKFRDYVKMNSAVSLNQVREMQKKFAVQFVSSSFLVNSSLESRYLREVEDVITGHERQALLFPTTFYQFLVGETSGSGYYGYLDFIDYIMKLRNRFVHFYLQKRYGEGDAQVESFVKKNENVFHSRSRIPETYWLGVLLTVLYSIVLFILTFWRLRRLVSLP